MVTENEKNLVFNMIDTLEECILLLEVINTTQGFDEESKLMRKCRESIMLGHRVANNKADVFY